MIEPDSPVVFSLQVMRLDDGTYVVEEQQRRRTSPAHVEVVGMVSLGGHKAVGEYVGAMVAEWEDRVRDWNDNGHRR